MNVIVSQQGSRENYSIPIAYKGIASKLLVYTDFFNKRPYSFFMKKFEHRYSSEIAGCVQHHPLAFFKSKILKYDQNLIDENYDAWVAQKIMSCKLEPGLFFTFSYNCNTAINAAKLKGWKVVMGQINPGPKEAEMVTNEYLTHFPKEKFAVPNENYWTQWRKSLHQVDSLIVNSIWSKSQLMDFYPEEKIDVIPLVANTQIILNAKRKASDKVKFIYAGALSVRKGFHYLQQALHALDTTKFEFHIVGRLNGPKSLLDLPDNVIYHGKMSHQEVLKLMVSCDVFVNPTLSDGFALTQLEAVGAGLTSIFTNCCAKVYTDGLNGIEIVPFSSESLQNAIIAIVKQPEEIERFQCKLPALSHYSLQKLQERLRHNAHENITRTH